MKGRRVVRSYTPREKKEALRRLALNGGNLSRTAEATGIPSPTLCRWRDEEPQGAMDPQAKNLAKFIRDAWRNIHSLNSPKFVKELKAQALTEKKSNLREIFAGICILIDRVITLTQLQVKVSKEAESDELEDDFTEEELDRMIKEEKEKIRKKRRVSQDEAEA